MSPVHRHDQPGVICDSAAKPGHAVPGIEPNSNGATNNTEQCEGVSTVTSATETGHVTGTADKDYNLIWFAEVCLNNALRLETYIQDAERDGDSETVELFRRAQEHSKEGGEQAKKLLADRLGH
jgi:hypothetical protein